MKSTAGGDHARHMDGIYRYQRYVYDATRKYYLLGRDRMIRDLSPPIAGTVLEIGCGTGRNLILAAERYPGAKLYGFDISEMMLETARANIQRAGLSDRITVAQGDASAFDPKQMFGNQTFDRVFISYALSMIPPWQMALPLALDATRVGGRLHIVDFGQQGEMPAWFKRALFAWLAKFTVEPRAGLEAALRLAAQGRGDVTFERLYRGYADLASVTRTA
jgi:S-adenosylmethionine-diacylgycerolhomoserine-N-methlytransferase